MSNKGLLIVLFLFAVLIGYNGNAGIGILFFFGSLIYFIPSIVALERGHQNSNAIFATNLLAGWTFVGWVIAMVWALTVVQPSAAVGSIALTPIPAPEVSERPKPQMRSTPGPQRYGISEEFSRNRVMLFAGLFLLTMLVVYVAMK